MIYGGPWLIPHDAERCFLLRKQHAWLFMQSAEWIIHGVIATMANACTLGDTFQLVLAIQVNVPISKLFWRGSTRSKYLFEGVYLIGLQWFGIHAIPNDWVYTLYQIIWYTGYTKWFGIHAIPNDLVCTLYQITNDSFNQRRQSLQRWNITTKRLVLDLWKPTFRAIVGWNQSETLIH